MSVMAQSQNPSLYQYGSCVGSVVLGKECVDSNLVFRKDLHEIQRECDSVDSAFDTFKHSIPQSVFVN